MLDKTYTIAFTHAPGVGRTPGKGAGRTACEVVHIPLLLCGVVPAYHIAELKVKARRLNFTGEILADIFLGKIEQWNDPALKAINPGVDLPAKKITVVHREDSSGTTQLFTEYLAAASPAWREQVGPAAAEVKWPLGIAAGRNQGVAAKIDEIDGAIGYVDRLYASFQDIKLDYGAVQNKDKSAFVRAEPANLTAAVRDHPRRNPRRSDFQPHRQTGQGFVSDYRRRSTPSARINSPKGIANGSSTSCGGRPTRAGERGDSLFAPLPPNWSSRWIAGWRRSESAVIAALV